MSKQAKKDDRLQGIFFHRTDINAPVDRIRRGGKSRLGKLFKRNKTNGFDRPEMHLPISGMDDVLKEEQIQELLDRFRRPKSF